MGGSSPRGRGTRDEGHRRLRAFRFIPAWAGNTPGTPPGSSRAAVHPRVGGEHALVSLISILVFRFIPAWAGNTLPARCPCPTWTVHPRVGGEHIYQDRDTLLSNGSSPRGRGTPLPKVPMKPMRRFIPAWAGNTYRERMKVARSYGSSPRGRGTHSNTSGPQPLGGSSPRGRGTQQALPRLAPVRRFIPAWAGNTPRRSLRCKRHTVHPRVGGEHVIVRAEQAGLRGSSPRGRGTLNHQLRVHRRFRFIPAWAGNTITSLLEDKTIAVHPRVGGEHGGQAEWPRGRGGSSPRGRGTLVGRAAPGDPRRFIPAWAGNTPLCRPRR